MKKIDGDAWIRLKAQEENGAFVGAGSIADALSPEAVPASGPGGKQQAPPLAQGRKGQDGGRGRRKRPAAV